MVFSRQQTISDGLAVKLRRAKTKSRSKNPTADWKLLHTDWIIEAKQGKYDSLTKRITQDEKNRVALVMQRRAKLVGKA